MAHIHSSDKQMHSLLKFVPEVMHHRLSANSAAENSVAECVHGPCAAMQWSEGDNWFLEADLFPGLTDFKCAVVRSDGSVVAWEPGANRTVEVQCSPHRWHE